MHNKSIYAILIIGYCAQIEKSLFFNNIQIKESNHG